MIRAGPILTAMPYDADDCYQVTELEPGLYQVLHFPNRETRKPCCRVKVRVRDVDRAKAIPDADPHGDCAALARACCELEKRHQVDVVDKN